MKYLVRQLILLLLCSLWTWARPLEEAKDFKEAKAVLEKNRYAQARQLTDALLKKNADNYAALLLLGNIYEYGEGSIPRAYFCYKRARESIEKVYPQHPETSASGVIYNTILMETAMAAQQLEHYQEALDRYAELERLYPKYSLTSMKGWPLLKLGRVEEARKLLLQSLNDPWHPEYRSVSLNTLGNIEFEADNLQQSYKYFMQIVTETSGGWDPVFYSNAAEAARNLLHLDEAEKLFLKASQRFSPGTYSNPWGFLALLYANESRMPEALSALKQMQAWRLSNSAQVSQNKWADCYGATGTVLLYMGYDEKALDIFERLIRRQDRNSSTSTAPSLVEARLGYLYTLALDRNISRLREKLSYATWKDTPGLLFSWAAMERQVGRERQRVANLVSCNTGIESFILPYGARALGHPGLSGEVWSCFGTGAVIAAAEKGLKSSRPEMEGRKPYLKVILGEAYIHNWRASQAQVLLEQAVAELPMAEVKLRNHCKALLARVFMQQGKISLAMPYLQALMDADPSQLRSCGMALPLIIETDGSPAADYACNWLYASPRCHKRSDGFVLKLRGDEKKLEGQLLSSDATLVGHFESQPRSHSLDTARSFCEVFHAQAFAPVIDLSQGDIRSIDGSTGAVRAGSLEDLTE